ncbi:hypothetical protein [Radiobacillus deserti]|uniref:DUF3993 domain-containing protein n=1 Tax=Radiobacillus deserti TaxID=2594883 RepID=A0A516KJ74_9BACI|nr:hypothetical protein [Radiobacillus deserti]QDP41440.1 hypothetical protein FN924_15390 [Radiobacillus deserti]
MKVRLGLLSVLLLLAAGCGTAEEEMKVGASTNNHEASVVQLEKKEAATELVMSTEEKNTDHAEPETNSAEKGTDSSSTAKDSVEQPSENPSTKETKSSTNQASKGTNPTTEQSSKKTETQAEPGKESPEKVPAKTEQYAVEPIFLDILKKYNNINDWFKGQTEPKENRVKGYNSKEEIYKVTSDFMTKEAAVQYWDGLIYEYSGKLYYIPRDAKASYDFGPHTVTKLSETKYKLVSRNGGGLGGVFDHIFTFVKVDGKWKIDKVEIDQIQKPEA